MDPNDNPEQYDDSYPEVEYYNAGGNLDSASKKRKRDAMVLTIPVTPKFHTTSRVGRYQQETTEERQLREIDEGLEQQRMEKELAEARKMRALVGETIVIARSSQPLTVPEEFSFATSHRGRGDYDAATEPPQPKRRKIELPEGGVTIPEAFSLTSDDRIRTRRALRQATGAEAEAPPQPWESLAAVVKRIQNKTPDRFKRVPSKRSPPKAFEVTRPIEPVFNTEMRIQMRPLPVVEHEEIPQFKARPLDRRIFESAGEMGVPRVAKRQLTVPESPCLSVKERAHLRPNGALEEKLRKEEEMRQMREFKALPINYHTSQSGKNNGPMEHKPLTVPESPFLATKERAAMKPSPVVQKPTAPPAFIARPMPLFSAPIHSKDPYTFPTLTEPEPFDLETEKRREEAEFRRNIQLEKEHVRQEAARKFKARPVPQGSPFRPVLELKVTEPAPFKLESEEKHALAMHRMQQQLEVDKENRRVAMEFKAKPFKQSKPFVPQRSNKALTEVDNFALNSEVRSDQRRVFENKKLQKEILAQEADRKRQILEAEREKREIKLARQNLIHKALPLPESLYKPQLVHKPAPAPVTEPKTPNLRLNKRRKFAGRDI